MKITQLYLDVFDMHTIRGIAFELDDGTRLEVPKHLVETLKRQLGRTPDDYWKKLYHREVLGRELPP